MDTTLYVEEKSPKIIDLPTTTVAIVETIISTALTERASDIHIDPYQHEIIIRFRCDGILIKRFVLPKEKHSEIISRIKILAQLRTDIHRAPQDGRIKHYLRSSCDIRLSIIPTHYGENAVLRILSQDIGELSLDTLGLLPHHQATVSKSVIKKSGMIILTGPTGSGKTTTLYTLLSLLPPERMIITIEDPIEYTLPYIRQIPVNADYGITFATGLRSILRQDPDVIMIGEIRDEETAAIAIHAALTGHLVFTTLHTRDALSVIPRLKDMNIPPYLIATTLELIIAQRLMRTLCKNCDGLGCIMCQKTGYNGRTGLYEIISFDKTLRQMIHDGRSQENLKSACHTGKQKTFLDDGNEKIAQGISTLAELLTCIS